MDVADLAKVSEVLLRKEPLNLTVQVNVSLIISLGFDKDEAITPKRLYRSLIENFNELWQQIDQAEAIVSVDLIDTEKG